MVYIMSTGWVPPQQARAYGKRALEALKKYPLDKTLTKTIILGAVSTTEEGIRSVSIYEVAKGQTQKALVLSSARALFVAEGIDGYKYKIETCLSAAEAMGVIGLQMPEDL